MECYLSSLSQLNLPLELITLFDSSWVLGFHLHEAQQVRSHADVHWTIVSRVSSMRCIVFVDFMISRRSHTIVTSLSPVSRVPVNKLSNSCRWHFHFNSRTLSHCNCSLSLSLQLTELDDETIYEETRYRVSLKCKLWRRASLCTSLKVKSLPLNIESIELSPAFSLSTMAK